MKTQLKVRLSCKKYGESHRESISENKKKYYKENRDGIIDKRKKDYDENPLKFINRKREERTTEEHKAQVNKYRLWKFYRLTPEDHVKIFEYQLNHPIYGLLLGQNKRRGTDHSHTNGLIRGLLDWRLNRALGLFEKVGKDNTASILRAMAEYLDHPPAEQALGRKVYGLLGQAKVKHKMVYGGPNEK